MGHYFYVRVLSETSSILRAWRQSKISMLALSLCVAALPVALLDVPVVIITPIASPSVHPDFRVVNVALHVHRHAAVSQTRKVHAELVDNRSGAHNNQLAADARSTNTLDWACIRNSESHDNYRQVSGAYGILTSSWHGFGEVGTPGSASVAVQDAFALRLFAANGHHFLGSWNDVCTMSYGLI
jgi:hypothetical protein